MVPQNFELDPDVDVTYNSAGFRWEPVDTSVEKIRGKFNGYKVRGNSDYMCFCWIDINSNSNSNSYTFIL